MDNCQECGNANLCGGDCEFEKPGSSKCIKRSKYKLIEYVRNNQIIFNDKQY